MSWVTAAAVDYDVLVIAGDLQNAFSDIPIRKQIAECRGWLLGLPVPTVVCSGNHDHWVKDPRVSVDTSAEGGWLRNLRGKGKIVAVDGTAVEIQGVRIACAGWVQPRWSECDVVVYHAPPSGLPCSIGSRATDFGDMEANDMLRESSARLFLAGHIHEPRRFHAWWPPGGDRETLVLVPGVASEGEVPHHWIVDMQQRVVLHTGGDRVGF